MKSNFKHESIIALLRRMGKYIYNIPPFLFYLLLSISCKKIIEIPPPASTVTTSQTFSTDELAISAMAGVYHKMINVNGIGFSNSVISIYTGTSSDGLKFFQNTVPEYAQFASNNLSATNTIIANAYWSNAFSIIYAANSIIDGLQTSPNIRNAVKRQLLGEAKFVRAFLQFLFV